MAIKTFILIETSAGEARQVAKTLRGSDGVDSVDVVMGSYDLVVVAYAPNINAMGALVMEKIQTIDGVKRTFTCTSKDSYPDVGA